MFGISASEFFVILCIAVIFIRPRDLPKLLRSIGRFYGRLKEIALGFKSGKDEMLAALDEGAGDALPADSHGRPSDEAFEPYKDLQGGEREDHHDDARPDGG